MLKFLKGEKSLTSAFGLGIFLVIATFIIMLILKNQGLLFNKGPQSFLLITLLIALPIRLFVWISVIRCSKNTASSAFRSLAVGLVIIDILSRLFYWGIAGFSMLERQQIKEKYAKEFEQCKQEISKQYKQPIENLTGNAKLVYNSERPHYEILTKSRTASYYCYCDKDTIELEEKKYSKWYSFTKNADIEGTYLLTTIKLTPKYLELAYGAPGEGDNLKVSGIYIFVSDADEVFTIYDYKSTSVWDKDSNLPTPKQFWSSKEKVELSVGGKKDSDVNAFVDFLRKHQSKWERLRKK